MPSTMPSFAELEAAARAVIGILKTFPEFSNSRVAVIGGLGLWKYLGNYRTTEDVDFLITVQGAPSVVKEKLLAMPSSPFQQRAQQFFYTNANGTSIQIDITPDWQVSASPEFCFNGFHINDGEYSPYLPSAAVPVSAVQPNSLPYISELDLLVFKINSCGLRPTQGKKLRDAADALALAENLSLRAPIVLSTSQKKVVLQGLDDVARISAKDKSWWVARLALN